MPGRTSALAVLLLILVQPAAILAGGHETDASDNLRTPVAQQTPAPYQSSELNLSAGQETGPIPALPPPFLVSNPDFSPFLERPARCLPCPEKENYYDSLALDTLIPQSLIGGKSLASANLKSGLSMDEPLSPIIHRGELNLNEIQPSYASPLLSYGPNTPPPANGDWIIDQPGNYVDNMTIILNGDLKVTAGDLTLDNITLKMNCTVDGQYQINVSMGGTLNVINTVITAFNLSLHYKFTVFGNMTMDRCNVSEMWGNVDNFYEGGGIAIFSTGTSIISSRINNSKTNGIQLHGNAILAMTYTNISSNGMSGLVSLDNTGGAIQNSVVCDNTAHGIVTCDLSKIEFTNCTSTYNNWYGIITLNDSRPAFTNCTLNKNNVSGISLWDSSMPTFMKCSSSNNTLSGIFIVKCLTALFTECTVTGNMGNGIEIFGSSPTFMNCTSTGNNASGIFISYSSTPFLNRTYIANNSKNGIEVSRYARPVISDCAISNNNWSGINIYQASTAQIINSTSDGNHMDGIRIASNSSPALENCHSQFNNWSGIAVYDTSIPVLINCTSTGNNQHGIDVCNASSPTLKGCISMGNNWCGIAVHNTSRPMFTDCTAKDNSASGIRVGEAACPTFTDCTSAANHQDGIIMNDTSTPVFIACNATNNSVNGVRVSDSAWPTFTNCNSTFNDNYGIVLFNTSSGAYSGVNSTANNWSGIAMFDNSTPTLTNCTSSKNRLPGLSILDNSRPLMDGLHLYENGQQNLWVASAASIFLTNSILAGGSSEDILLSNSSKLTLLNTTCTKSALVVSNAQLKVQWYLTLKVLDRAGKALTDSVIDGYGMNGSRLSRVTSGPDGMANNIIATEYIQNSSNSPFEFTYYSPYAFNFVKGEESNITPNISVSSSHIIWLYIDFTPRIALLPEITVMEDLPKSFDLTPYLSDPDDPVEILGLMADRDYISVKNGSQQLLINCPVPLGSDTLNITVSDGMKSSLQTLTLTVTPTNDPICVMPIPDQIVYEDQTFELALSDYFYDEENGTNLTFGCNIDNIIIDNKQKKASWTPTESDMSLHGVILTASDGLFNASSNEFDITVLPVNDAPVYLGGLSDKTVMEHTNWTTDLSMYFRDEENSAGLVYESSDPDVTINRLTNTARWSPSGNSRYTIEVVFIAHDAQNYSMIAVSDTIKLTYGPVNDPPIYLGKLQGARLKLGEEWNITLEDQFRDDDTDTLKFAPSNPDVKIIDVDKNRHVAVWKPDKYSNNVTGLVFDAYDGLTHVKSAPIDLTFDKPQSHDDKAPIIRMFESIPWYIYALLPAGILSGVAAFYSYRRIKYGKYEIEQLFLVYNDGRLLSHRQKKDTAQVSNDLLMGMLTALKGFIRESLQDQSKGELDEMKYGDLKIAIEHGKNVYLAAFISGYVTDKLKADMRDVLQKVEASFEPVLRSWDGMMVSVEGVGPYLDELLGRVGPKESSPPK